MHISVA